MATMTERATVPGFSADANSLESVLKQRKAELYALHKRRQQELTAQAHEQYEKDLKRAGSNKELADELYLKYQNLLQETAKASEEELRGALEQEKAVLMWTTDGAFDEDNGLLAAMMEEQQRLWDNAVRDKQGDSQSRRPSIISEVQPQSESRHAPSSSSSTTTTEQGSAQPRATVRPNDVWIPPLSASVESTPFPGKKQRSVSGLSQSRPPENHVDRRVSSMNYSPKPTPKSSTYFGAQPVYDEPRDRSDSGSDDEDSDGNEAESVRDSRGSAQRPRHIPFPVPASPSSQGSRRPSVDAPISLQGPQKIWKPSHEESKLHSSPKPSSYVPSGLGTSPKTSDFAGSRDGPSHKPNIQSNFSRASNASASSSTDVKDESTLAREQREAAEVRQAEQNWKNIEIAREKGHRVSSFSTPHQAQPPSHTPSDPDSRSKLNESELPARERSIHTPDSTRSPSVRLSSEHHEAPRSAPVIHEKWVPSTSPPRSSNVNGPRTPDFTHTHTHTPRSASAQTSQFPDLPSPHGNTATFTSTFTPSSAHSYSQDLRSQQQQQHTTASSSTRQNSVPLTRAHTDEPPLTTQRTYTPLSKHNTEPVISPGAQSVPFPHKEEETPSRLQPSHLRPPEASRSGRVESNASSDSRFSSGGPPPKTPPLSRARTPDLQSTEDSENYDKFDEDMFESSSFPTDKSSTNFYADATSSLGEDDSDSFMGQSSTYPEYERLAELIEEEEKIKRERVNLEKDKQDYAFQMKEKEKHEEREIERKKREMEQKEQELKQYAEDLQRREEALAKREAAEKEKAKREAERRQQEMDRKREEIQRRQQHERLAQFEKAKQEEEARKAEQQARYDYRSANPRPASTASFATFASTSSTSSAKTSSSSASQSSASSGWTDSSRTSASSTSTRPTSTTGSAPWNSSASSNAKPPRATPSPSTGRSSTTSSSTPGSTPKTSQSSRKPTDPPGASSSSSTGTGPFVFKTEEDRKKWQEDQARRQQEQFERESQRAEKEKQAKAAQSISKEQVIRAWNSYEQSWVTLKDQLSLRFRTVPWPLLTAPKTVEDLTTNAIGAFVLSPHTLEKTPKDRLKEQLLRWHPDRFENKWLPKVDASDRDLVKLGAGQVVRSLNELLSRENNSPFG